MTHVFVCLARLVLVFTADLRNICGPECFVLKSSAAAERVWKQMWSKIDWSVRQDLADVFETESRGKYLIDDCSFLWRSVWAKEWTQTQLSD